MSEQSAMNRPSYTPEETYLENSDSKISFHVMPTDELTNDFLVQTCARCGKKFQLSEGDVIFGSSWYHRDCWQIIGKGDKNNVWKI